MAHGKETPRQKMIGMMYLVLMAMLALNVSADVLNAFVLVDEGLTKTTVNFANKNAVYYEEFDRAAAENPVKAGPWKDKAYEVKSKADELYNYIQELKIEIVQAGDGEGAEAVHENEVHSGEILAKDKTDAPAVIMIGPDGGGKANDLKSVIDGYRDYLISIISEESGLHESIEENLNTHDHKMPDGETHSWQSAHFEHLPLIGVITIMSAMQSNVRNAESEALNYLYQQIDAGSFKFNLIEPVVIPQSNYVVQGADYEASVFMAAFDTTQEPTVYIGQYDSTINDDGTVDYSMVGELGRDYDTIPVQGGKGVYRSRGSSLGDKTWGGIIALKRMDGTFTNKPFRSSYRVAPQALVVSPTKMNVFYQAVDNPVEVSVPGFPASSIQARINNGSMRGSGTHYTVIPRSEGEAVVSVSVMDQGVRKSMGQKRFRVRPVPDPIPTIAGRQFGTMAKAAILGEIGVQAEMPEWFNFELEFTITSFDMEVVQGGFNRTISATNYRMTNDMRQAIRDMRPGSNVLCTNIKAIGPDGAPRDLPPLAIKIR